jgi:hypothetical protein
LARRRRQAQYRSRPQRRFAIRSFDPLYFDECEYDSTLLAAHGLALLFIGGRASVLASACVRAGDLLVQSDDGSFLLRRHGNPPRLLIVGAAILAASYTLPNRYREPPAGCICWSSISKSQDGRSVVILLLELPDTVALGSAIAQPAEFGSQAPHDRDRILSYLASYAFGTVMAHSGLGSPPTLYTEENYTLTSVPPGYPLRKTCTNCEKTGNPFWYLLCPIGRSIVLFAN